MAKEHKHSEGVIEEMNEREGTSAVGVKTNTLTLRRRNDKEVSED